MNHDYTHCLDYTNKCPKSCFRAELERDIKSRKSEFIGVPLSYAHFVGSDECDVKCKTTCANPLLHEKRCFNCYMYNGDCRDDTAFCDERQTYVPKYGWCYRWNNGEK